MAIKMKNLCIVYLVFLKSKLNSFYITVWDTILEATKSSE